MIWLWLCAPFMIACGVWLAIRDVSRAEVVAPFVCPGCHAVGGERCAPDCVDARIEREREEDRDFESSEFEAADERTWPGDA